MGYFRALLVSHGGTDRTKPAAASAGSRLRFPPSWMKPHQNHNDNLDLGNNQEIEPHNESHVVCLPTADTLSLCTHRMLGQPSKGPWSMVRAGAAARACWRRPDVWVVPTNLCVRLV